MSEKLGGSLPNTTMLAGEIIAAYVSNNPVPVADLPALIAQVHGAITGLASGAGDAAAPKIEKPAPAQIQKSVTPDALISFLDGRPYKTLKRHLAGHGLTPEAYRERYGLPRDYPMVAANYAEQRSALAKSIGLGRPGARAEAAPQPEPEPVPPPPKGRRRKAA